MSDVAIKFENVSKLYELGTVGTGTLSHDLKRWWITSVLHKEDPYLKIGETNDRSTKGDSKFVYALKDIDFEVKQGDVLGIIGKNGAGKSTLLKLLSRVTAPTTGKIFTKGRIASLLEVGTGFHPELTGRENIYMNGTILGMKKWEIDKHLDEIVAFSGCERYLDTPVKRYSSGMTVRLGFAIAAHLNPEILVVDEVLAVGDAEFQKKAIGKMQDVSRGDGRTVLFVSHNMDSVLNLCNKGLLLENGVVKFSSTIEPVVNNYLNSRNNQYEYCKEYSDNQIYISSIKFGGSTKNIRGIYAFDESLSIHITIRKEKNFQVPTHAICDVILFESSNRKVCTNEYSLSSMNTKNEMTLIYAYPKSLFAPGEYFVKVALHTPNVMLMDVVDEACTFRITDNGTEHLKYNGTYNGVICVSASIVEQ